LELSAVRFSLASGKENRTRRPLFSDCTNNPLAILIFPKTIGNFCN
jgi:hypothetical protein